MNKQICALAVISSVCVVACGSEGSSSKQPGSSPSAKSHATTDTSSPSNAATPSAGFNPPDVADGYTRVVAPVIDSIPPGGDVTRCQFVLTPFDRDMDVLDVQGYQSTGGHHSVAYAVKDGIAPTGTSRDCTDEDNTSIGGFLGGVGGEAGGKATLPDGVVFRLAKGSTIMLSTHFINTTEETIDGQTVLDVKFDEVDTSRKVASMFVNVGTAFSITPQAKTTYEYSCTAARDMQFLGFTNHMHSLGSSAQTLLFHGGEGDGEPVHTDTGWTSDMQFNPVFTNWTLAAPLTVKAGDVLRTHCEWTNPGSTTVAFPREMCVGFGFFLNDSDTSPLCFNGTWSG